MQVDWNVLRGCVFSLMFHAFVLKMVFFVPNATEDGCPLPYVSMASALMLTLLVAYLSSLGDLLVTLERQGRLWKCLS